MKEGIQQSSRWLADGAEIRKVVHKWPWEVGMDVLKVLREAPALPGSEQQHVLKSHDNG